MNKHSVTLGLLALGFAAACVPASAHVTTPLTQPMGKALPTRAGYIDANGKVAFGHGFTVEHTGTGQYRIAYLQGDFQYFPAMVVTPFGLNGGLPIANLNSASCASGYCIFDVGIYASNGTAMDNGFAFEIIEAR